MRCALRCHLVCPAAPPASRPPGCAAASAWRGDGGGRQAGAGVANCMLGQEGDGQAMCSASMPTASEHAPLLRGASKPCAEAGSGQRKRAPAGPHRSRLPAAGSPERRPPPCRWAAPRRPACRATPRAPWRPPAGCMVNQAARLAASVNQGAEAARLKLHPEAPWPAAAGAGSPPAGSPAARSAGRCRPPHPAAPGCSSSLQTPAAPRRGRRTAPGVRQGVGLAAGQGGGGLTRHLLSLRPSRPAPKPTTHCIARTLAQASIMAENRMRSGATWASLASSHAASAACRSPARPQMRRNSAGS